MRFVFKRNGKKVVFGRGTNVPIPVEVREPEECEAADFCVCLTAAAEPEEFKGSNIHTTCADCGQAIVHRPNVPVRPPKVCIYCAEKRVPIPERKLTR